jgi:hypothetical protein|tara:strand:- start:188 stop:667 length:480 start_codon:yes stop_codon:yes gene_type:complete
MFKIIDNFLNPKEHFKLKTLLESNLFPWYFIKNTTDNSTDLYDYHFCHNYFCDNQIQSDYFNSLKILIDNINIKKLIRARANLTPASHKQTKSLIHKDQPFKCKIAIYYVNTNNGYTNIDGKKIKSIENRIVFFNNEKHYGTTTTDSKNRILINLNYEF